MGIRAVTPKDGKSPVLAGFDAPSPRAKHPAPRGEVWGPTERNSKSRGLGIKSSRLDAKYRGFYVKSTRLAKSARTASYIRILGL